MEIGMSIERAATVRRNLSSKSAQQQSKAKQAERKASPARPDSKPRAKHEDKPKPASAMTLAAPALLQPIVAGMGVLGLSNGETDAGSPQRDERSENVELVDSTKDPKIADFLRDEEETLVKKARKGGSIVQGSQPTGEGLFDKIRNKVKDFQREVDVEYQSRKQHKKFSEAQEKTLDATIEKINKYLAGRGSHYRFKRG
jgi:hypothetical protein